MCRSAWHMLAQRPPCGWRSAHLVARVAARTHAQASRAREPPRHGWSRVCACAQENGIPAPQFFSISHNLIQSTEPQEAIANLFFLHVGPCYNSFKVSANVMTPIAWAICRSSGPMSERSSVSHLVRFSSLWIIRRFRQLPATVPCSGRVRLKRTNGMMWSMQCLVWCRCLMLTPGAVCWRWATKWAHVQPSSTRLNDGLHGASKPR
jgi:hypothetical protein